MSLASLAYNPISFAAATATASSAAAGYPATNVLTGQVLKPWRSTSLANTEYIIIDLGAIRLLNGAILAVSATNLATATVYADSSNPPTTSRGTITPALDAQNRGKASLALTGLIRYIKILASSGSPIDGAAYWSIGPVDVFVNTLAFPRDPIFGESSLDTNTPQTSVTLDNGKIVRDSTGPSFMTPTLTFSGGNGDDHEQIAMLARSGLCWLDLGIATNRGLQWRVMHYDPKITRKLTAYNRESVQIALKEEV